ncbi:17423_t:CDS:2 [Racocetra persica]|uniref:17423_t:CDS:1 n=1 Tax=Racocetra persica TaxID=160502 RepID=A0ACA9P525_9GLOM|nr:17423_t:CDS:2 [Racocetra persica]
MSPYTNFAVDHLWCYRSASSDIDLQILFAELHLSVSSLLFHIVVVAFASVTVVVRLG